MVPLTGGARLDTGRLIVVPAAAALLVLDVISLARGGRGGMLGWLSTALICAFYVLVIWCYLRRGPARASSGSVTAHAAAVTATVVPFSIPLFHGPALAAAWQGLSDTLLVAGTAWALWSLHCLGRNLSVLAQAREVADRGPYRWVRHPLYTGEIISALGLALLAHSRAALAVWLLICALQVYRARCEEQVLLAVLPEYHGYRTRTAALLPGVF